MAFKKKSSSVDFVQKERDELPQLRPVIIYISAPSSAAKSSQYKHFEADSTVPTGVLKRDASPINFCLIEASSSVEELGKQVSAAMELYKDSPHKEIAINAHGTPEGILTSSTDGEKTILTGEQFAKMVLPHTHDHFLHVFNFISYGHSFAQAFYATIRSESSTNSKVAVTYFTSASNPTSWDKIATSGSGHVEVTRDLKDYIRTYIEPNTPHKMIDDHVKPSCLIL